MKLINFYSPFNLISIKGIYLYFIFKGLRPANMIQPIIQKTKREKVLDYIYKNADLSFARFIKNHA